MEGRSRTQVYFTAEQRRGLDAAARRQGRTMAEVVREATAAYLEREARTIALPGDVAARLDALAAAQGTSSEHLAARLLRQTLGEQPPRPRVPLTEEGWGGGDDAERVDELLAGGFGTEA